MQITFKLFFVITFLAAKLDIYGQQCYDRCQDVTAPIQLDTTSEFPVPSLISGCLTDANPETLITSCGAKEYPTVWFKVKVDSAMTNLQTKVYTNGEWTPIWSIYYGDCSAPILIDSTKIDSLLNPCSNSDSNPFVHNISILDNINEYWVVVSGIGIIDDPNFTLNISASKQSITCIGEIGCIPMASWQVTKRSSEKALDDPRFCPEEEVTICVNFKYDPSATAYEWLHGLIPDFGNGWDLSNFNGGNISSNYGKPTWVSSLDSFCAPVVRIQMPYLCTYLDTLSGRLKLCNTQCEACPCQSPLPSGSKLPSGWFWNTPSKEDCISDCRPSTNWGIGTQIVDINFCIDLKVKKIEDELDCLNNRSLSFNFQTTSDAVTGCWTDPSYSCLYDYAQINPVKWELDCARAPKILGKNIEICSNQATNLNISTEDGSNDFQIHIIARDNPYIVGQRSFTFTGSEGIINDTLVNESDTTQSAFYEVFAFHPEFKCSKIISLFEVKVHPKISFKFDNIVSCYDTIITIINPEVSGGLGELKYKWSTGDTTKFIYINTDSTVVHSVVITDSIGCTIDAEISVNILDSIYATLNFTTPVCTQQTIDIGIYAPTIVNNSSNVTFRLLDCLGNQVVQDTTPYIVLDKSDFFKNLDYKSNNCFKLETTILGCVSISDSIIVSCISSVNESITNYIRVIPNPSSGQLSIINEENIAIKSISIYNVLGQGKNISNENLLSLDISYLKNGVYYLSFNFENGNEQTLRIVLVK